MDVVFLLATSGGRHRVRFKDHELTSLPNSKDVMVHRFMSFYGWSICPGYQHQRYRQVPAALLESRFYLFLQCQYAVLFLLCLFITKYSYQKKLTSIFITLTIQSMLLLCFFFIINKKKLPFNVFVINCSEYGNKVLKLANNETK